MIDIEEIADEDETGNFEITCKGKLLHSNQKGQGFLDSPKKQQALSKKITALI